MPHGNVDSPAAKLAQQRILPSQCSDVDVERAAVSTACGRDDAESGKSDVVEDHMFIDDNDDNDVHDVRLWQWMGEYADVNVHDLGKRCRFG